ncbi:MAG TPA: (2Fe-2S)-binding protein [candidate division Zixibacteria bacterium]|nr:(2Fe-2S)-binding protein [candidate division Zixibacteria bacterium]
MVTKSAVSAKSGELITKDSITVTINGRKFKFSVGDGLGDISPSETLLETLRTKLQMTGAKSSCQVGACGCCAVIVNGDAVAACMTLTIEMDGKNVVTVEGLEDATKGLDPLQQAFIDEYAFQCGYCTPGIIMVAKALFNKNEHPNPEQIREALAGNYCRCISHYTVLRALNKVAGNTDAELSNFVRANDLVEDPIPVTEEVYPSPYAYGTTSKHSVD